jgi:hypothetical protein
METSYDILIGLASISGIFIGFTALITASDDNKHSFLLKGVINIGMLCLVASLFPILLGKFNINKDLIWRLSGILFFIIIWFSLLHSTTRRFLIKQFKIDLKAALFFWVVIETPIQLPLIFCVLNIYPEYHEAFLIVSIVLNIIQAGYLLVQFVHAPKQ